MLASGGSVSVHNSSELSFFLSDIFNNCPDATSTYCAGEEVSRRNCRCSKAGVNVVVADESIILKTKPLLLSSSKIFEEEKESFCFSKNSKHQVFECRVKFKS